MNNKIYIESELNDKQILLIRNIMKTESGIKEIFENKDDRYNTAYLLSLIKKDNEIIGFLNLVPEHVDGFLFMDMGILEKYRGKGYGKLAYLDLEKRLRTKEFIIAQTKSTNLLANKSAIENGILVYTEDKLEYSLNYYLMNKDRYNEFLNSEHYQDFIDYCNGPKPKQKRYFL